MSSASLGLAPREGLELELMKLGYIGPPLEPCRRLQAGKSGDPRSQNADRLLSNNKSHALTLSSHQFIV